MGSDPSNEVSPIYLLPLGLSLPCAPDARVSEICQHDLRGHEWGSAEPHFLFLVGWLVRPELLGWVGGCAGCCGLPSSCWMEERC